METQGMLLTLARAFGLGLSQYRVLASRQPDAANMGAQRESQLAALDLNRQMALPDGQIYTIGGRGGPFSLDRELWRGAPPVLGEPPVAVFRRERKGLRRRDVLIVDATPGRRLLVRRRAWLGSRANADVVAFSSDAEPSANDRVLLHAEKSGTWRKRIQAQWLAPSELPLPITVFILNVLADLDRRAAAAASAAAAGV